jgi:hypothetical protein
MMRTCLVRDNDDVWYLDYGATCHITSNKEWFIEYENFTNENFVYIGDDSKCQIEGIGTIPIILNNRKYKEIQNVLHVPRLAKNLLSVHLFRKAGYHILFANDITFNDKEGKIITNIEEYNDLFKLGTTPINVCNVANHLYSNKETTQSSEKTKKLWHARLGHIGYKKMKDFQSMQCDINIDKLYLSYSQVCESYIYGRQSKKKFPKK